MPIHRNILVAMKSEREQGALLATAVLLGALLVAVAPAERTLGNGIKTVYVHVAFTWAGLSGFALMALLGLAVLVTRRSTLQTWAFALGCVAAACFAIGAALSALASWVNWGGVYLAEPRMRANVLMIATAVVMLVLTSWPLPLRLRGALNLAPAGVYLFVMPATPLVMHPGNPIGQTTATSIQLTFVALYALCAMAALCATLLLHGRIAAMPSRDDGRAHDSTCHSERSDERCDSRPAQPERREESLPNPLRTE
jgi:hypothetical protein